MIKIMAWLSWILLRRVRFTHALMLMFLTSDVQGAHGTHDARDAHAFGDVLGMHDMHDVHVLDERPDVVHVLDDMMRSQNTHDVHVHEGELMTYGTHDVHVLEDELTAHDRHNVRVLDGGHTGVHESINFPERYRDEMPVETLNHEHLLLVENPEEIPDSNLYADVDNMIPLHQNQHVTDQSEQQIVFTPDSSVELIPTTHVQAMDAKEMPPTDYLLYPIDEETSHDEVLDIRGIDTSAFDVHPFEDDTRLLDLSGLGAEQLQYPYQDRNEYGLSHYGSESPEDALDQSELDELTDEVLIDTLKTILAEKTAEKEQREARSNTAVIPYSPPIRNRIHGREVASPTRHSRYSPGVVGARSGGYRQQQYPKKHMKKHGYRKKPSYGYRKKPSYDHRKKPSHGYPKKKKKKKKKKVKDLIISVSIGSFVDHGTQFPGTFKNAKQCRKACNKHPNCLAADFNKHSYRCYYHRETACDEMSTHPSVIHMSKIPCEQDLDTNGLDATVTIGMSAPYGFLMKKVKNLQECLKKCLNAAGGIAPTPIDAVGPDTGNVDNSIQAQYQLCFGIDYDFSKHKCYLHFRYWFGVDPVTGDALLICNEDTGEINPLFLNTLATKGHVVNIMLCPTPD